MGSKLGVLLVFIFFGTGAFSQHKQDIGLKIGSLENERAQLDYRFHLKSPYALAATYCYGTTSYTNSGVITSYSDSTLTTNSEFQEDWFHTIKVGVQRKFTDFASDVFYAGATLGVGYFKRQNSFYQTTFVMNDSLPQTPVYGVWQNEIVSSSELHQISNIIQTQIALTFGMDVPISKRFLINAEVGLIGNYAKGIDNNASYSEVIVGFSGGVRYQFGVR